MKKGVQGEREVLFILLFFRILEIYFWTPLIITLFQFCPLFISSIYCPLVLEWKEGSVMWIRNCAFINVFLLSFLGRICLITISNYIITIMLDFKTNMFILLQN